jgi:uncharacterized ion transporter superfamily protein YfcC
MSANITTFLRGTLLNVTYDYNNVTNTNSTNNNNVSRTADIVFFVLIVGGFLFLSVGGCIRELSRNDNT